LAPQQELGLWPQWRDRLDIGNRIDSPIAGRDIAAISDGAEVGALPVDEFGLSGSEGLLGLFLDVVSSGPRSLACRRNYHEILTSDVVFSWYRP
jgi:hypothetical protein